MAILVFLKTMTSYNSTSLTPSLFTEVPVLSQESERSCICVLEVMYMCVRGIEFAYFYDFSIEFLEFFRQCDIFFFHFITGCEIRIMMMYQQQGLQKKYCKAKQYYFGA